MAQSITLMGATYPDVPSVLLPKSTSGMAQFDDTTIASNAASAADIASGKLAWVNGSLLTGTGSGGGSSPWHKLITAREDTVSTTSTTVASAFTVNIGSAAYTKDQIIWVHIRDKAGKRDGYFYGSDAFFINFYKANGATNTLTTVLVYCFKYSGTTFTGYASQYGLYGYSIKSDGTLTVRKRYSSSYSLTVNGTYVTNVYALDLPDNLTLF